MILAWYLTRNSIDVLIPGAKRPEQVINNLKALDIELSPEQIEQIDKIFAKFSSEIVFQEQLKLTAPFPVPKEG